MKINYLRNNKEDKAISIVQYIDDFINLYLLWTCTSMVFFTLLRFNVLSCISRIIMEDWYHFGTKCLKGLEKLVSPTGIEPVFPP